MKMISNTSITSTMGVTLISELKPPEVVPWPLDSAIDFYSLFFASLLEEEVDQLSRRIIHLDHEIIDFADKVVEQPDCRHRHCQSDRGRHQGFCNTTGYGRDTGSFSLFHCDESIDDPEYCSEQSNEWRCRTNRRQTGKTTLELRYFDRGRPLQ